MEYGKQILKHIGAKCKEFRTETLNMTQKEVAQVLGYSPYTISWFENGRNDNCEIFLFYVKHGLLERYTIEELTGRW